jgi:hypothetical protein
MLLSFNACSPVPDPEPASRRRSLLKDDNDDATDISKGSAIEELRQLAGRQRIHRIVFKIIKQINKDLVEAKDIDFFGP